MRITIVFLLAMLTSIHAQAQDFMLAQGSSAGTVTVSPNSPQPPFFLTEVSRLQSNGSWEVAGTTYQSYTFTDNVGESGTYTYRTRWYNPQSTSPYNRYSNYSLSRSITISVSSAPSSAPSLSVPSVETNDGQFNVSWSAPAGATNYTLQRRSGTGSWLNVSTSGQRNVTQSLPNGTYSYRVSASNSFGTSAWSSIKSITVNVTSTTPPSAPASTYSPTASVIVWTASNLATYYELRTGSTVIYSGLNTYYYDGPSAPSSWSVRACNAGGCSAWKYGSKS
jgi:hypothetical protein